MHIARARRSGEINQMRSPVRIHRNLRLYAPFRNRLDTNFGEGEQRKNEECKE